MKVHQDNPCLSAVISILLEGETQRKLWLVQNNKELEQYITSKTCSFLPSQQDAHSSGIFSLWFHVQLSRNTQRHLHCWLPQCKQATEKMTVLFVIISNKLMSSWAPLSKRANVVVSVGVHEVCRGSGVLSFSVFFWVHGTSHICFVMAYGGERLVFGNLW